MIIDAPVVFVWLTIALWAIGVWRMAFRWHTQRFNSFFLGVFVMSFAGIWISLLEGH